VSLHFLYYNFVRIHQKLRVTPAMAAGIVHRLWDVEDMVLVLEKYEQKNSNLPTTDITHYPLLTSVRDLC